MLNEKIKTAVLLLYIKIYLFLYAVDTKRHLWLMDDFSQCVKCTVRIKLNLKIKWKKKRKAKKIMNSIDEFNFSQQNRKTNLLHFQFYCSFFSSFIYKSKCTKFAQRMYLKMLTVAIYFKFNTNIGMHNIKIRRNEFSAFVCLFWFSLTNL